MPLPVERLHFSVFDLHLWRPPLVDTNALSPSLAFLADPQQYAKIQVAANKLELPNLWAFPLTFRSHRSRFWVRYADLAEAAPTQVRAWLLPLRCRPKNLELVFDAAPPQPAIKVFATIWLWPFGWASSLEFALKAPLSLNAIQGISAALRGRHASPPPFALGKERLSLANLFGKLAQTVRDDVGAAGTSPGEDLIVPKHIVLALVPSRGTSPRRYGSMPSEMAPWSDSDRARLHGALLGDYISTDDVIKRESESVFMLTQFGGGNFGLTYFQEGTLLLLGPGEHDNKWRESGRCFARNVSSVSLVAMTLQRFIDRRERLSQGKPAVSMLAGAASQLLDDLATGYGNPFAKRLLEMNGPLRRARAT